MQKKKKKKNTHEEPYKKGLNDLDNHEEAQMVKNLPAMQDMLVQSLGQEHPLEKGMAREFHGQRSLAGYSPGVAKN